MTLQMHRNAISHLEKIEAGPEVGTGYRDIQGEWQVPRELLLLLLLSTCIQTNNN
jgi:hypothetical protein